MDLAEALIDFTNAIIPNFIDPGTSIQSHISPSPYSAVHPFLILMAMNLASIAALAVTLKVFSIVWNLLVDGCRYIIKRAVRAIRTIQAQRQPEKNFDQENVGDTSSTDEACGRSWTEGDTGGAVPDPHHDELCEALATLGLKASATEIEVKKAYYALMKQYHPDRYMRASRHEQERVKYITVRIRHAYDVLSREGHRLQ